MTKITKLKIPRSRKTLRSRDDRIRRRSGQEPEEIIRDLRPEIMEERENGSQLLGVTLNIRPSLPHSAGVATRLRSRQ